MQTTVLSGSSCQLSEIAHTKHLKTITQSLQQELKDFRSNCSFLNRPKSQICPQNLFWLQVIYVLSNYSVEYLNHLCRSLVSKKR